MLTLPLRLENGHAFLDLAGDLWLLDTGAPNSFGTPGSVDIADGHFRVGSDYLGLTAETLSQYVGISCVGLLGADVLGRFDHIFEAPEGRLTLSSAELPYDGADVPLDMFMGIPIVTAVVADREHRIFFDTGAQFSYFQDDALKRYPAAGAVTDFYPGVGQFETETHDVPVSLGGVAFTLRFGQLPHSLGMTLMMASTTGILGNAILAERTVGYFPRRRLLVL